LLEPARQELELQLGSTVTLVIEKDKLIAGPIHPSMFGEAATADIYIADLTGANPNVYLELGVRWTLRDGVTILISQDIKDDVKFNVSGNRVIPYGPNPKDLKKAISAIVKSALTGLKSPDRIDSPVRNSLSLCTVPRSDWEAKEAEIARLREMQGEDLIAAAAKSPLPRAIELLRQAVERNPGSVHAHYELGVALRKAADYEGAIIELRMVVDRDENSADGWRELGVALSKSGQLTEAEDAFRHAVELAGDDAETWATLGGLRRRLARSPDGSAFDWELLRESRDAYRRASQILGNDTYALVNEARLDLLLSATDPAMRQTALNRLRKLENLARFEAEPDDAGHRDPWKLLDLADTLLLTGRGSEGLAELLAAIDLIDPTERRSMLSSVIGPLRDFLAVDVLDEPAAEAVREAIKVCEKTIEAVP
jgi:tetratricopeptide (TPR) repeat protein